MTELDDTIQPGQAGHIRDHEVLASKTNWTLYGEGDPEGNIAAPVGSVYHRTDGAVDEAFYVKQEGESSYGWHAVRTPETITGDFLPIDGSGVMLGSLNMGGHSIENVKSILSHKGQFSITNSQGYSTDFIDSTGKKRVIFADGGNLSFHDAAGATTLHWNESQHRWVFDSEPSGPSGSYLPLSGGTLYGQFGLGNSVPEGGFIIGVTPLGDSTDKDMILTHDSATGAVGRMNWLGPYLRLVGGTLSGALHGTMVTMTDVYGGTVHTNSVKANNPGNDLHIRDGDSVTTFQWIDATRTWEIKDSLGFTTDAQVVLRDDAAGQAAYTRWGNMVTVTARWNDSADSVISTLPAEVRPAGDLWAAGMHLNSSGVVATTDIGGCRVRSTGEIRLDRPDPVPAGESIYAFFTYVIGAITSIAHILPEGE